VRDDCGTTLRDGVRGAARALRDDRVFVRGALLDAGGACARSLAALLSPDEQRRGAGFRLERDRVRFIVRRGLLRRMLALRLGVEPVSLRFGYGSFGKPYLLEPHGGLRFSVAHSSGLAVYALAVEREVGIDIERVREESRLERLAAWFVSPSEERLLNIERADARRLALHRCWTRKEAYLKAVGTGLSIGPKTVAVTGEPPVVQSVVAPSEEPAGWGMATLEHWPGYVAAVVAEGRDWRVVEENGLDAD
jgi:4'-phosphopantetheinyl transferase